MNITKTNIKKMYKDTICIGYCELHNLLKCKKADFYTTGIYGWNADIYPINLNTAIITGYRPFGTIKPNYKIIKKYDEKARKILEKENDFEKANKKLDKLIEKFIEEVKGE